VRNAAVWVASFVLVAGALSAAVGTATVQWLYPKTAPGAVAAPAPVAAPVAAPGAVAAPAPVAAPVAAPAPARPTQAGPVETVALESIRLAGDGNVAGTLALTAPGAVSEASVQQLARLRPTPLRAARLPGAAGEPVSVLVWADYRREDGKQAHGVYQVAVTGEKVTGITGPVAPDGGYRPLPLEPLDEKAHKVDMAQYKGKGLVLWAPRNPEPGLAEAMAALQGAYASQGVAVVLVLDVPAPDWLASARQGGFQGPVWRIKGRLEDVPVPSKGIFLGATGVLVNRDGLVVASLAALDPGRYALLDQPVQSIARAVFEAYGLLN
jgi:hypothetical protein